LESFDIVAGKRRSIIDYLVHLRKENKRSRRGLSDEEVKALRDELFEQLRRDYEEEPEVWHDYLVKQMLRENGMIFYHWAPWDVFANHYLGQKYLTWNGNMQNAMQPSIDATRPAPINPETGETGYHIRGNLGITSWSLNVILRYHSKVLLKAVRVPPSPARSLN
jgi:hypothetical protein